MQKQPTEVLCKKAVVKKLQYSQNMLSFRTSPAGIVVKHFFFAVVTSSDNLQLEDLPTGL